MRWHLPFSTVTARCCSNDGENGADMTFDGKRQGFVNGRLKDDDDLWRLVWLTSPDSQHRIVVGQELDYRQDMALSLVTGQLTPWLVTLPLLMLLDGADGRPRTAAVAHGRRRFTPARAGRCHADRSAAGCRPKCVRWWMR
ncbi:Sensor protein qseC [Serratia odorifera]|uniref:Sensor protein qseC n=1 Tax=Serratia odorifera TaxID=618 RepID=A0A3S4EUW3_SEROD|nr:Sensor protein qseC [Serratia odorifera]